jgi:putative hydroxymethylpyrimidine transport system substrate-binding protein
VSSAVTTRPNRITTGWSWPVDPWVGPAVDETNDKGSSDLDGNAAMPLRALTLTLALLAATPAAADDELTLMLDWFVNPDHAPIFVAEARGHFEAAGLEVEIVAPADPNDPPKLVAAGQADVAISYQPQLHIQVDQGLPLTRIGTLVATPLNALVVLADSDVRTIADLKGRKVGFSVGGFEDALLAAMLARHGLGLDAIELINVNFALSPALLSGQVDGVIGAFRNFELNQLDLEGRPGRAFFPEEEGVPAYDELIFVANTNALDDPRLPRFLDAIEGGVLSLLNHPEESYQALVEGRPELDDELNRRAWQDTLPRFALRPAALDRGRYARFAAFLHAQELIGPPPPVETYALELDR